MKIGVVGFGKVGSAFGAWLVSAGHEVYVYDVDRSAYSSAIAGLPEPGVSAILRRHQDEIVWGEVPRVLRCAEASFVIVPTPSLRNGAFDATLVRDACLLLARNCRIAKEPPLICVVSTVSPGTMDTLISGMEHEARGAEGERFFLCYTPVLIALGKVLSDLRKPPMLLIGSRTAAAWERAVRVFETLYPGCLPPSPSLTFREAELAKLGINTFLTMKVGFANLMARLCQGRANVDNVTGAIGLDSRIGGFYWPAVDPPRDNAALLAYARHSRVKARISAWA